MMLVQIKEAGCWGGAFVYHVIDITNQVKSTDWSNSKIIAPLVNPKQGLYLLSFKNDSNHSIHDRNFKKGSPNKDGKVIVPRRSTTVKFGKFQNSLKNRLIDYHKHMHFPSNQILGSGIFSRFVERVYVLSIPTVDAASDKIIGSHIFENLWNSAIDLYLTNGLLLEGVQNYRSEYRNTKNLNNYYTDIENLLSNIATTIMDLRQVIKDRLHKI